MYHVKYGSSGTTLPTFIIQFKLEITRTIIRKKEQINKITSLFRNRACVRAGQTTLAVSSLVVW